MLIHTKRLLKRWHKEKSHVIVNAVGGKDKTNGHYVRVLMIRGYPPVILAGYLDQLDHMVTKERATLRKTIRYAANEMKFNYTMKNKLNRLEKSINAQSLTDPARNEEVAARDTILALRDSSTQDDRRLVDVSTFLTISAEKLHQVDAAESNLRTWFDDMSGSLDSLYHEQLEAMRQTSPVKDLDSPTSKFFSKNHYGRATTDSVAARTYPFTRGSFSDGRGLYFGRRTEDGGFCFVDLCNPDDERAQNITVFGKTGQGKSFFMKALVVSLLEEGVHVFVFDLDGEWHELCEAVGGVYIDHTSGEGRYFEPLTIMPKIPEFDRECIEFNQARHKKAILSGVRTFSQLADKLTKEETYEVGESIKRVFEKAGINKDRVETWDAPYKGPRPTIHLAFADIAKQAEGGNVHALSLFGKIKIYFIGVHNDIFSIEEPLTFQNAPLVVYKVGSGLTSDNQEDERAKQAQLKMSMSIDVVNSNIQKLKFQGEYFSAVVVDEGQRQTKNIELRNAIFEWYTSIRKWNGMMILGSNTPAIMLDSPEGVGMWENTSVRVYFYMEQSAIRSLAKHSAVPIEIQERIGQSEDSKRFILEYHKKYDELMMHVPTDEIKLYKTRGLKQSS